MGGAGGEANEAATGGKSSTGGSSTGGQDPGGTGGNQGGSGGSMNGPECTPYPDGLVLFFSQSPFPEPVSEAQFTQLKEEIQGRNLEVSGTSFSASAGPVGTALNFTDDVFASLSSPTNDAGAAWPTTSLEFWVKTTDKNTNLVAFHSQFAPGVSFWSAELAADGRVQLNLTKGDEDGDGPDFGATWQLYSTSSVNNGKPHHIAVVNDFANAQVTLYIDGKSEGVAPLAEGAPMGEALDFSGALLKIMQAASHPLVLGGDQRDHFFEGQIDEVSIYSSKLSKSSIEALYAAASAGKCLELASALFAPGAKSARYLPSYEKRHQGRSAGLEIANPHPDSHRAQQSVTRLLEQREG
jgi:hypothetical protein